MKHFFFEALSGWYYWIGLIATWLGVLYLLAVGWTYFYPWFYKKYWKGSWLYQVKDYCGFYWMFISQEKDPNGGMLWIYEFKLKKGAENHIFKKQILHDIPLIVARSEKTKRDYDDYERTQKEHRQRILQEKGWQQCNDDNYSHPEHSIVPMNIWDAFTFQLKLDKTEVKFITEL